MSQFRKENRQDDAVVGEYSYVDPFGKKRTVKYTADKIHGFRADIYVDGKLETPHSSSHHEAQVNEQDDSSQYQDSGENSNDEDY